MATNDSGYYILLAYIKRRQDIAIGKRATDNFPRGWYAYAGSAMHGLSKRVARHKAGEKKMHWHIDYLLKEADLRQVFMIPDPDYILRNTMTGTLPFECAIAARLEKVSGARREHKRFGAGDCTCPGHLIHFSRSPEKSIEILVAEFFD